MKKKLIIKLSIYLLLAITVVLFTKRIILPYVMGPYYESKFNREVWINEEKYRENKWYSPRIKMIADLRKNYLKKGMSQTAVRELLGEPLKKQDDLLVYPIGARMNRIDPDFLEIYFDLNGHLIETKLIIG
jgi:hypothetical protein